MKDFTTEQIRNIAIIGHGGCGKTALTEAMLYNAGMTDRLGRIDDGTTTTDFTPEEIERGNSIYSALGHCFWNDKKINIIDTPGFPDFLGEVVAAMRVAESALIVVDGVSGVEVVTEKVWQYSDERNLPRMIFVNKMDKEHSDFEKTIDSIRDDLMHDSESTLAILQLPFGYAKDFTGYVNLLTMKAYKFVDGIKGEVEEVDIPADLKDKAQEFKETLTESVAESDDALMEKYFEAGELTREEIAEGLSVGIANGTIYPVLCGAAFNNQGVKKLLDIICDTMPSPSSFGKIKAMTPSDEEIELDVSNDSNLSALVFKTMAQAHVGEMTFFKVFSGMLTSGGDVYNSTRSNSERISQISSVNGKKRTEIDKVIAGDFAVAVKLKNTHTNDTLCLKSNQVIIPPIQFPAPVISYAIEAKTKGEEDKVGAGLQKLAEQDPTFTWEMDPVIHQTIIYGMGEMHLNIIVNKLQTNFNVQVELSKPRIPYRETFTKKAEAQGKYKKQSGGRGQYGDAHVRFEPLERDAGFEFVDAIVGGVIPGKFLPSVEKGIKEAMTRGVLAGYPVVDLKATCFYGSFHPVDSSDNAFKMAGSMALKKVVDAAGAILLEPILEVEVIVPDEYMGDVMGDVNSRRGRILGMDQRGSKQVIKAQVPEAEMHKYSTDLRSLTQGRGLHTQKFSHYDKVPNEIAAKIIAESKKDDDDE